MMNDHYFSKKPTSKVVEKVFEIKVDGSKIKFTTVSGVFSFGKPDRASLILLKNFPAFSGDILDLGCGYGLIGITLKVTRPYLNVFMSDVNERAIRYARINAKNNNVTVTIVEGDGLSPWKGRLFDSIALNPPISAGKKVWVNLIFQAHDHLKNEGTLVCVGFHNKAGKTVEREMKEIFGNVLTLAKSGGVRVYMSRRINR